MGSSPRSGCGCKKSWTLSLCLLLKSHRGHRLGARAMQPVRAWCREISVPHGHFGATCVHLVLTVRIRLRASRAGLLVCVPLVLNADLCRANKPDNYDREISKASADGHYAAFCIPQTTTSRPVRRSTLLHPDSTHPPCLWWANYTLRSTSATHLWYIRFDAFVVSMFSFL